MLLPILPGVLKTIKAILSTHLSMHVQLTKVNKYHRYHDLNQVAISIKQRKN